MSGVEHLFLAPAGSLFLGLGRPDGRAAMSDVFISYGHSTAARQARGAAEALRALGYSVWIDDDLPAHRAFTAEIEAQLTAAKAALVIWSEKGATSHWVLSEANRAREDNKLVQLRIDGARLPMPFDQIQCADLSGWSGEGEHPAWSKVTASVAHLVRGVGAPHAATDAVAAPAASAEPLLAVLAFDNLSGDPETAYFSDGVSEEILQTLARSADLKVIGRASSFQFRGAEKAAGRVAASLNATHVLDGSVRRAGSKVRVAANLIECEHQTNLWSDRYDRDLTDVFALWDEIAASVAAALKTAFARSPPPSPIDPAAYDLFLRVQAYPFFGFAADPRRPKMLEEVVGRAPTFARGWATLAIRGASELQLHREDAMAAGVTRDRVVEAAGTALRLDPHMGLAYQALGYLQPYAAYREQEALNEQALAAAPSDASVLANMGMFCAVVGRPREGLSFARRAYELDPLDQTVTSHFGTLLNLAGQFEEAGRLMDAAGERWPENALVAVNAMVFAARLGDKAKVLRLAERWTAAAIESAWRDSIWYARNLVEPNPESLKAWVQELRDGLARTGTVPLHAPQRLNALGLTETAFELIDRASYAYLFDPEAPSPPVGSFAGFMFAGHNAAMMRDPRFVRFCAKIGLVSYWIETGKWPDCADVVPYDFRAEARQLAGEGHR
jgi:TolB-like protein/Tfp pilus assembly protein PilF